MQINSINNTNFTGKTDKQYDRKTRVVGTTLGAAAGYMTTSVPLVAANVVQISRLVNLNKNITDNSVNDLRKVFSASGLKSKNVELLDIKHGMAKECEDTYMEACKSVPKIKKLMDKIPFVKKYFENIVKKNAQMVERGMNAFALFPNKKIVINMKKFGYGLPHEIGHQLNHHFSKIGKGLQKVRSLGVYTSAVVIPLAMFSKKRDKADKSQNIFQKTVGFIRNNAGKLITLSFIPMAAEETLASIKGLKLAKTILNKNDYVKALRVSIVGGSSYYALALIAGVGTALGIKVKDRYIETHKQERN